MDLSRAVWCAFLVIWELSLFGSEYPSASAPPEESPPAYVLAATLKASIGQTPGIEVSPYIPPENNDSLGQIIITTSSRELGANLRQIMITNYPLGETTVEIIIKNADGEILGQAPDIIDRDLERGAEDPRITTVKRYFHRALRGNPWFKKFQLGAPVGSPLAPNLYLLYSREVLEAFTDDMTDPEGKHSFVPAYLFNLFLKPTYGFASGTVLISCTTEARSTRPSLVCLGSTTKKTTSQRGPTHNPVFSHLSRF